MDVLWAMLALSRLSAHRAGSGRPPGGAFGCRAGAPRLGQMPVSGLTGQSRRAERPRRDRPERTLRDPFGKRCVSARANFSAYRRGLTLGRRGPGGTRLSALNAGFMPANRGSMPSLVSGPVTPSRGRKPCLPAQMQSRSVLMGIRRVILDNLCRHKRRFPLPTRAELASFPSRSDFFDTKPEVTSRGSPPTNSRAAGRGAREGGPGTQGSCGS
jgi:hypothetical protein